MNKRQREKDAENRSDSDLENVEIVEEDSSGSSESENEDVPEPGLTDDGSQSEVSESEFEDLLREAALEQENDFESDESDVEYVTGADGNPRPIRPEIEPEYSSDDSDANETNTIGNIPISAYEKFPHIGYNIDGKRIMRPATASAVDALLETIDLPKGYTGLIDKTTGTALNLTKEERELINRIQSGLLPNDSINPFEDQVEWFSSKPEIMPLSAAPEPKRRFVPSQHEEKRILKLAKAIREGRITFQEKASSDFNDDRQMMLSTKLYDVWAKGDAKELPEDHLPAPKMAPPTHEESYNPPEEYLFDDKEKEAWENTPKEDRETNFVPQKYSSLRMVPGYNRIIEERFERCLDLYLAPRYQKQRLNIDPDSLIPELPSPQDLRPFPIRCSTIYSGHVGRVRTLSVDPTGQYLATGGEDGTVRIWEVLTGRILHQISIIRDDTYAEQENQSTLHHEEESVDVVSWNPRAELGILAVAAGDSIYLVVPPGIFDTQKENAAFEELERGWAYKTAGREATASSNVAELEDDEDDKPKPKSKTHVKWTKPGKKLLAQGVCLALRTPMRNTRLNWHNKGDYFVSVHPKAISTSVLVHQVSKHTSQSPFKKSKGIIQEAKFHPFRPHLYVASQRYIRVYDLSVQKLVRKLQPGVRWLAGFDIHPRGDNLVACSYDKRVIWHDLELNDKPYKTLRYHNRAVRDARCHSRLPLFCTAADDGNINVMHCTVYDDLLKNPLLVPLKILRGHAVKKNLGVLEVVWHPREAWLFSAGSDGTARLWTT